MKAELNINTDELAAKITQEVIQQLKPLLIHDPKRIDINNTLFTVGTD